ncbi:MAG TPA: DNA primase [Phycisphaerales bacterium]|nr:DNA primase [Phycisphaerales bacterium]
MNNLRLHPGVFSGGSDRSDVDRVKDATDIVRLIGEHVALRPKGREYMGLCPFHDDHSPSMHVVPHKQFYKCFSCGAAGDVFKFVQDFLKMDFPEALEFLADRAGIALERRKRQEQDADAPADSISKKDLLAANAMAASFYRAMLKHEQGAAGRAVIEKRGISPQMVEEFQLGVSPDRWDGLILTAQKQGFSAGLLGAAGLIKAREGSSGHYDAFRNRVMFPICDRTGRVIAFGARKIKDEDEPKYLNSPETRLFNKSATLYALHLALRTIQQTRTAIICEGYTDVIACHQAGFRNAVATLGTAMTRQHAAELRLACDRVLLLFDSDEAGQRAADRAAEVFFSQPIDVGVVTLRPFTDAKDPDELLKREGGGEAFKRALEGASDLLAYRFARVEERLKGAGLSARSRGITEEIERLVELGLADVEPVRKALIIRSLARIAGVSESVIRDAVPAGRQARPRFAGEVQTGVTRSEESAALMKRLSSGTLTGLEHLLGCVLCEGNLWQGLTDGDKDALSPSHFPFDALARVAQAVHDLGEDGETPTLQHALSRLSEPDDSGGAKEAAVQLMSRVYEVTAGDTERVRAHFSECLRMVRRDRALAQGTIETKPGVDDAERTRAAAERIALVRADRDAHGPDRRKVPRPR